MMHKYSWKTIAIKWVAPLLCVMFLLVEAFTVYQHADVLETLPTLQSKDIVTRASDAYEALTPTQKALVSNYGDLVDAKSIIDALENDEEIPPLQEVETASVGEASDADCEAARVVESAINAIPYERDRMGAFVTLTVVMILFVLAAAVWSTLRGANISAYACVISILIGAASAYQMLFDGYRRYMLMVVTTLVLMAAVYMIGRRFHSLSKAGYLAAVGAVGALLLLNLSPLAQEIGGAKLWVNLFGFSFQPSEFIKVLLVVIGASSYRNLKRGIVYSVASVVSCGVLLFLHDLGNAAVIFAIFLVMTYLLFDNRLLSASLMVGTVIAFLAAINLLPYAKARVENCWNAMNNEDSYQQASYIRAVLLGGADGLGYENSHYMSETSFAADDGALAGVLAVFGLGMILVVMGAYALLIMQSTFNRSVIPSSYFILAQLGMCIAVPVLLHFMGALDVIPYSGVVAPLISRGGSSLLSFGVLFGIGGAALDPYVRPYQPYQRDEEETCYAC